MGGAKSFFILGSGNGTRGSLVPGSYKIYTISEAIAITQSKEYGKIMLGY